MLAFCPPDHHHNRDFLKRCRCWHHRHHFLVTLRFPPSPSTTAHSIVKTYFLSSFFVSFVFIVFACLTNILPLDNERKAKQQTSRAESSAPKTTILYNHQEWICLGIDSPSSWWNASCCCTPAARLSSILWAPHGHRAQAPTRHCVGCFLSFCYGGIS